MNIRSLVVEVTRKCNISCAHCLRGNASNMDMKKEYIDSLLNQVKYISDLTFSGGEPSLNVPIMEYFLEQCKVKKIGIGGFYIATNGMKISESFVMFCLKMYSYCDSRESCCVELSNDIYHKKEGKYDINLLQGLSFFGKKFEVDNFNYNGGTSLKSEGRNEGSYNKPRVHKVTLENLEDCIDLYLNCKGEIINGCDWSYKNQRKHKLCDVGDLELYYANLKLVELGVD